jgi:hypothetical protein
MLWAARESPELGKKVKSMTGNNKENSLLCTTKILFNRENKTNPVTPGN